MAGSVVQSTGLPFSVTSARNGQSRNTKKTKRTVTLLCNLQTTPLRMGSFSGLRTSNALDLLKQTGQTLQSKIANVTSFSRGRKGRIAPRAMYERFTEKAIKVIMLAQEEARRLGHNYVGTEQILLGLIGEGTGIAAKVAKSMGINLKDARVEVEKIIGKGSGFVAAEIPFTPGAKRVFKLSLEEADQLGHNYIGSEHMLLGLLSEGEGVAARVLENLSADPSNIHAQVIRMVGDNVEAVGAGAGVGGGNSGNKMPTLEDLLKQTGLTLQSKIANVASFSRGRKGRIAPRTMYERFTEKAIKVIMLAQEEARRLGHNYVGTEQILLGLIGEGTGIAAKVLKSMGINLKDARVEVEKIIGRGSGFVAVEILFTPGAKRVLELSLEEANQLGHNYIGSEHLLLGLLCEGEGVAAHVLENLSADPSNIHARVIRMVGDSVEAVGADVGGESSGNKMPTLEEYGTNLTKLAEEGKLDPVIGRQDQIERVTQILRRHTKNNACLIGEPGVGKKAIAEGLALRIANGDVPETIQGKKVITLDMGLLVAGTKYRGEFEERLKKLMEEIKRRDDIILFIDEVHTLIGAGAAEGAKDAANILKPALARGELQCIGATKLDEYRKHIKDDPALQRCFQPVKVQEPTVDESIQILKGIRERYEIHHKLRYTDESLVAAARLSHQYMSDRFLPDKAIDLIDEAGYRVRLRHAQLLEEARRELEKELRQITKEKNEAVRSQDFKKAGELLDREMDLKEQISALIDKNKEMAKAEREAGDGGPVVTEVDIQHIVSSWTGIPVEKISTDESDRVLKMEEILHTRVIGKDEAVKAISRAIRRARVGLKNPNRPIASFIFSGPTGVGKSELAKVLAGSEEAVIRLDMSEFGERHTVSKLIGSPPGYVGDTEGGQLTEAVRRRPYTVVLFDEIEKAHPDVFNMILQILEDGRLTDSKGRTVDFKNTLLIMTSNCSQW